METMSEKSSSRRFRFVAALIMAVLLLFAGAASADKVFVENDVVIIGKGFVKSIPFDEGVVLESRKGVFEPVTFLGVEGTAAMLFLYNRITRDMGVDLVLKTYKGRIDRKFAEEKVDLVLRFYADNKLIYKSRFVEKPASKIGIARFRI